MKSIWETTLESLYLVYTEETQKRITQELNRSMIKYLILDVDGTFTDGGVYYNDNDNEIKKFCTKDGTGIVIARAAGIKLIVLTGRSCPATEHRMTELHIDEVIQGVFDKAEWMRHWMSTESVDKDDVGYIGDDINDLGPMRLCSWIGCPADAATEVKEIASYVSPIAGGHGAVRDCIEKLLRDARVWSGLVEKFYGGAGV